MNEYFCVFKRKNVEDLERRVVIESHGDVFSGLVRFGSEDLTVGDVQSTLKRLVKKRKQSMALWCSRQDLPKDSPFHHVAETLDDTCSLARDEIFEAEQVLEEMAQYGMTAWIDETDNNSYFELKAVKDHLAEVELACAKVFIGTLKMHVIFIGQSYYITLADVDSSEQSLEDNDFPDISSRGSGFQIKLFQPGLEFQHLALWQLLDEHALNMRNILRERARGESKEEKSGGRSRNHSDEEQDEEEEEQISQGYRDISHIDDDYLWGKSKEAFGGSYTQTYLMLRPEDRSQARRALFRYGNWCYGGYVDMDQQVTLHEIPHVLRKFQRQQGKLAYWFEVQSLPDGLPFSAPMKHFAMANAFLEQEITKAEETLTQVTEYHKSKGIPAWIDEENGSQFFELETVADQDHYKDVELMASKTYYKEVVVITIFFQGSFYMTLSPSVDDQPLLDMSFPDVESKGRALQIATYQHPEFKKLMLWQSTRSVWETANKAVLEQRRQAALKRQREQAQAQEEAVGRNQAAALEETVTEETEPSVSLSDSETNEGERNGRESKCGGGSESKERSKAEMAKDKAITSPVAESNKAKEKAVLERKPSALTRGSLEQKMQGPAVRGPHHLKPLGSLAGGNKLPELDKGIVSADAPWDALGRPKSLFAKK